MLRVKTDSANRNRRCTEVEVHTYLFHKATEIVSAYGSLKIIREWLYNTNDLEDVLSSRSGLRLLPRRLYS